MTSIVQAIEQRVVGTVEEVSADRITILLHPDTPQATALDAGAPMGFPRINGYVLIPNESGATACIISSVRIARLPFPKRKGTQQDFGLVDLPFPSRMIGLTPIGTLKTETGNITKSFRVHRGVDVFPSVGDPVYIPTPSQLRAIVEGDGSQPGRILLGYCPTAGRAPVHVDPDKLFGRHLAVLGNTGAGKSCSVAGLIRWSLDAAAQAIPAGEKRRHPNGRFIVLDPNGEYASAFNDLSPRIFRVSTGSADDLHKCLHVPAWLWNSAEWVSFTDAAPGAQRPVLLRALRRLRAGSASPDPVESKVASAVSAYKTIFAVAYDNKDHLRFPQNKGLNVAFESAQGEFENLATEGERRDDSRTRTLRSAAAACEEAAEAGKDGSYIRNIDSSLVVAVLAALDEVRESFGVPIVTEVDADVPRPFDARQVPAYVDALAGLSPGRDLVQFVDTLNLRIGNLLEDDRLSSVIQPDNPATLEDWLTDYIGADQADNGSIAVLDLSLVPSEVTHIIVSVLARMVFEALQRYRRMHGHELPTTLVLEEAHTFVHRSLHSESAFPAGRECVHTFERIAREGRKFGLGLVLASQRPSEVSATVLSQCNTFLLHRLVNDQDQELVRKLVPDGLGVLLRELPSLPTRRAMLLGWAAPAPTLVEIQEIPEGHRPHSPDPRFWDVWTRKEPRTTNWKALAGDWQQRSRSPAPSHATRRDP